MNVEIIAPGTARLENIEFIIQDIKRCPPLMPFAPELVSFVSDFSNSLLLDRKTRQFPELMVLANFFRKRNLRDIVQSVKTSKSEIAFLPRGIVFHVAPSNVDSIFLYSSLISFICGNINLIRISQPDGVQLQYVLSKLRDLFAIKYKNLASRLLVITYGHNDNITTQISEECHMRVVWGGDNTVKTIRKIPLRSTAIEICFPNRFSVAMIRARSIIESDAIQLRKLCTDFFKDTSWFSQQACSSPRLIAWIGSTNDCLMAQEQFWLQFSKIVQESDFDDEPGMAMDRFVANCMVSLSPKYQTTLSNKYPTRLMLESGGVQTIKELHCGNGLFFEQFYESTHEFIRILTDTDQTVSVYGFKNSELLLLMQDMPMRAVDRFVEIGHSLDFTKTWDGLDLVETFMRKILVDVS